MLKIIDNFCEKVIASSGTPEKAGSEDRKSVIETRSWSSAKNIADWFDYLSADILGMLCFGKSFDMLSTDANRHLPDVYRGATSGLCTVRDHVSFNFQHRQLIGSRYRICLGY